MLVLDMSGEGHDSGSGLGMRRVGATYIFSLSEFACQKGEKKRKHNTAQE